MKRWKALLLAGVLFGALGPRLAVAEQMPVSDAYDTRMRLVAYNPGQVVHLSTIVGATMVVSFGTDETVTAVAEADTLHLAALPKGNFLFLKPGAPLALQPIIVLTQLSDGRLRRYVFEIETVDDTSTADGADGVYYAVQFSYPQDEAAAAAAKAAAEAAQVAKLNAQAAAQAQLTAANDIMTSETTNPVYRTAKLQICGSGRSFVGARFGLGQRLFDGADFSREHCHPLRLHHQPGRQGGHRHLFGAWQRGGD